MLTVDIDSNSGFCAGVIRAIGKAEEFLKDGERLYSLGAIVHNDAELSRLVSKGLVTIDKEDLGEMIDAQGGRDWEHHPLPCGFIILQEQLQCM